MDDVETTRSIANRVRRQTTNRDILALCDAVLASLGPQECPVCVKRRAAKADSQRRWRAHVRGCNGEASAEAGAAGEAV